MVKLFVGNLVENCDKTVLIELFSPYVRVTECDVLKNYAFVHIDDESKVEDLIKNLDGHSLNGRSIHVERSTSRLRKQPGMGDKCFRCGSTEHKTTNCPHNEKGGGDAKSMIKIDLTNSAKRPYTGSLDGPSAKQGVPPQGYYGASGAVTQVQSLLHQQISAPVPQVVQQQPLQQSVDAEIPRPLQPDLQALYDQYAESRQRYLYFRDRLVKEMQTRTTGGVVMQQQTVQQHAIGQPIAQLAAQPITYVQQQPQQVVQASHPYGTVQTALKAPYSAVGTVQTVQPQQMVQYGAPNGIQQPVSYAVQQPAQNVYAQQQQQPMQAQQVQYQHQQPTYGIPASNGQNVMGSAAPTIRWA